MRGLILIFEKLNLIEIILIYKVVWADNDDKEKQIPFNQTKMDKKLYIHNHVM